MAISKTGSAARTATGSAAPQQPQQAAPQAAPFQASLRDNFRSVLPTTNAGENVKRLHDAWKKTIADSGIAARVHVLDNKTRSTLLSCLCITIERQAANGRSIVAVHTAIVEASNTKLPNRIIQMGGQAIELPTVAGDAFNDDLWGKVKAVVSEAYGNVDIYDASASVIPSELDPADEVHVHRTLVHGVEACFRTLENVIGGKTPFALSMIPKSERLTARVDVNPVGVETAAGLPVRSDIAIQLTATDGGSQNDPFSAPTSEYTTVDGFVDLVYVRPAPPAYGQQPMTQHYYPRFVITQLESRLGAVTMEIMLLALHTATLLGKNLTWANCFLPRVTGGDQLRDIGAISLDIPALTADPTKPSIINTGSTSFSTEDFHTLITTAIHGNLIYSMDVEECGANSWLSLMFIAAAQGSVGAQTAIIEAADNLTGGLFSQHYKGGQIIHDDVNRIHNGYYLDSRTNQRRDLRALDYLGVLGWIGKQDMSVVVEWDSTFNDLGSSLEVRLQKRTKLLQKFFTDCKIKGFSRRITFMPAFIEALNAAIDQCGVSIQPSNIQFDMGGNQRRGAESIAGFAVDSRRMAGMFNYSTGPGQSQAMNIGSRWARH